MKLNGLRILSLTCFVAACGPSESALTELEELQGERVHARVSAVEYDEIIIDQEPLVLTISAILGETNCYTFSHIEYQKTATRIDLWLYALHDSTRQCAEGSISLDEIQYTIEPPFGNPLLVVVRQPDTADIEIEIEVRFVNHDPQWTTYTQYLSGLPSNIIRSLAITYDGVLWAASSAGIFQIDDETIISHTEQRDAMKHHYVESMSVDINGNLWAGAWNSEHISKFDGSNWTLYEFPGADTVSYMDVHSILAERSGTVWVGTHNGHLLSFDGTNWTGYDTIHALARWDAIEALADDPANRVWVGMSDDPIGIWDGTKWEFLTLPMGWVTDIQFSNDGIAWIGAWYYLHEYDGQSWNTIDIREIGLGVNHIEKLAVDSHDGIWMATDGGLLHYDRLKWEIFNSENSAFVGDGARAIVLDASDRIWLNASDFGLAFFDRND